MSEFTDWLDPTVRALGYRNDAEFARALDVDQSVVSRWRTGSQPSVTHLGTIGRVLGIALEPLLVLSGYCEPSAVRSSDLPPITAAERAIRAAELDDAAKVRLREYWAKRLGDEQGCLAELIAVFAAGTDALPLDRLPFLAESARLTDIVALFGSTQAAVSAE